jgi:hypothetical protein
MSFVFPGKHNNIPNNSLTFHCIDLSLSPDDSSMTRNIKGHCMTNKLSYAQCNVSELFGILLCLTGKQNSYIVLTHNRMHELYVEHKAGLRNSPYIEMFQGTISYVECTVDLVESTN